MKRFLSTAVALALVAAAYFTWVAPAKRQTLRLAERVALLEDSVALLGRSVDSLRARLPGLGEYMSGIGLHAAKLWYAERAGNWALAGYERDELDETIEGAGALRAKRNGVDITPVLESVREGPLESLSRAIASKDARAFDGSYDLTLAACNGCHDSAGYGFIHVVPPAREPVVNQRWAAPTTEKH